MKTLGAFALLATFVLVPVTAQKLNLNFDAITKNAKEKTELSIEGPMLESLRQKALFAAIDQISIHNYKSEKPGEYADSELDPLRMEMAESAGWSRVLNVKKGNEGTQIYVSMQGDKPSGFLLIAAEAKEVTVIFVTGSIELAQLKELINSTIQFKDIAQE